MLIASYLLLRFIHFSDIHFKSPHCNDPDSDPDIKIRDAVLQDIQKMIDINGEPVDGILITGDIAFAGREDEYSAARGWLTEVSSEFNIPDERIYVVPGNHDVDRNASNKLIAKSLRSDIRTKSSKIERDTAIDTALKDTDASQVIFTPMHNYINFSKFYGCGIGSEKAFWRKQLTLSENVELHIRGITTTLFSNKDDDKGNLLLGSNQLNFRKLPGVLNLSLMHHPCDWLRDSDDLADQLSNSVHIQLFGHKHRPRWDSTDNTLRVTAISLHPERGEAGYEPGYNIIDIEETFSEGNQCKVSVKVVVRKLETDTLHFRSKTFDEDKDYIQKELTLNISSKHTSPILESNVSELVSPRAVDRGKKVIVCNSIAVPEKELLSDIREASRVFNQLSRSDKDKILIGCDLLKECEFNNSDIDKQMIAFKRARKCGKEEMLCNKIFTMIGSRNV